MDVCENFVLFVKIILKILILKQNDLATELNIYD